MNLNGAVAMITGGARIGITVAEELAREGCNVSLVYRSSRASAERAAEKVREQGSQTGIFKGDMTKEPDIKRVIKQTLRTFGRIDILVNMVSIYESTPWGKLDEKVFNENFNANLKSAYLTSLHAAPFLKKSEGRIVNFSDWVCASGRPRYKGFIPYFTSKMGLLGLTQSLALELAPQVLVNAIAPGPILPPVGISSKEKKNVEKSTPLGRWGGSLEIAKTVLFLCKTDFVTGECIRVDGGRHLY